MAARHSHGRTPALFVYGSLLNRENWKSVLGAAAARAIQLTPVRLRGWRRNWNGVGHSYGGMVLNLKRDAGAAMWGALVTGLSAETWALLDEQERSHLPRSRVLVVAARGRRVWAYCYRQRFNGPEGRPRPAYLATVRKGAKSIGGPLRRDVEADVGRLLEKLGGSGGRAPRKTSTPPPTAR